MHHLTPPPIVRGWHAQHWLGQRGRGIRHPTEAERKRLLVLFGLLVLARRRNTIIITIDAKYALLVRVRWIVLRRIRAGGGVGITGQHLRELTASERRRRQGPEFFTVVSPFWTRLVGAARVPLNEAAGFLHGQEGGVVSLIAVVQMLLLLLLLLLLLPMEVEAGIAKLLRSLLDVAMTLRPAGAIARMSGRRRPSLTRTTIGMDGVGRHKVLLLVGLNIIPGAVAATMRRVGRCSSSTMGKVSVTAILRHVVGGWVVGLLVVWVWLLLVKMMTKLRRKTPTVGGTVDRLHGGGVRPLAHAAAATVDGRQ